MTFLSLLRFILTSNQLKSCYKNNMVFDMTSHPQVNESGFCSGPGGSSKENIYKHCCTIARYAHQICFQ